MAKTTHAITADIRGALRKRFREPEWAILEEVRNGTGARATRSADAIAINCWPSRGMEIHGVEIKASRSDWLRELKKPDKSEPIQRYCDRWWLAVPPGVVEDGELPATWGMLLLQKGKRLVAKVDAPVLEPAPLTKTFLAALGRAMHGQVEGAARRVRQEQEGDADYQRGLEDGKKKAAQEAEWKAHELQRKHDEYKRIVTEFREGSGLAIQSFSARRVGEQFRLLLAGAAYGDASVKGYQRLASTLREHASRTDAIVAAIGEMEAFLRSTDEGWKDRLHAMGSCPGWEYRIELTGRVPSAGWEPNPDFDRAFANQPITDNATFWRRRLPDVSRETVPAQ